MESESIFFLWVRCTYFSSFPVLFQVIRNQDNVHRIVAFALQHSRNEKQLYKQLKRSWANLASLYYSLYIMCSSIIYFFTHRFIRRYIKEAEVLAPVRSSYTELRRQDMQSPRAGI